MFKATSLRLSRLVVYFLLERGLDLIEIQSRLLSIRPALPPSLSLPATLSCNLTFSLTQTPTVTDLVSTTLSSLFTRPLSKHGGPMAFRNRGARPNYHCITPLSYLSHKSGVHGVVQDAEREPKHERWIGVAYWDLSEVTECESFICCHVKLHD
jgi:hypothetical protein